MARGELYPKSVDPGFPELPSTPDGWTRRTFGDVVEVVERPVKLDANARYRLLTAKRSRGGITLRGELDGREILTKSQFEARAGDFLISRRQIIHGACGVVPQELGGAIVSNEYSTLRTRAVLTMEFLLHYSHTPYFQRTCFHSSHGVDVEKMIFKINEWLEREVDVPPIGEQRKIAGILSSLDDAIEATQAVVNQLHAVKHAMMAELLTRGLPGVHGQFKRSEIGEVPDDWEVVPLEQVALRIVVGIVVKPASYYVPDGVPALRGKNVRADRLELDDVVRISEESNEILRKSKIAAGDVLTVRTGEPGTSCVVPAELDGANCIDLILTTPDVARLDGAFLSLFLNSDRGKAVVTRDKGGLAQQHFNVGAMKTMLVPLPSTQEQKAIVAALTSVESRIEAERETLAATRKLKFALMSVLLSGDVRVSTNEGANSKQQNGGHVARRRVALLQQTPLDDGAARELDALTADLRVQMPRVTREDVAHLQVVAGEARELANWASETRAQLETPRKRRPGDEG